MVPRVQELGSSADPVMRGRKLCYSVFAYAACASLSSLFGGVSNRCLFWIAQDLLHPPETVARTAGLGAKASRRHQREIQKEGPFSA